MRAPLLIALVAFASFAQGRFDRASSRCAQGRSSRGLPCADLAFLEFAPTSGAGMGVACACTAPSGAKGETFSFSRSGSAMCSKVGYATTGIANGDLVNCASSDTPRVVQSQGSLGVMVESSSTNLALRSQEFDNAAWVKDSVGVALPTVTANAATAPDGTVTADQVDFPATTALQHSVLIQTHGDVTGSHAFTLYVRGVSSGGSFDVCNGNATFGCTTCTFVSTSWTRCLDTRSSISSGMVFVGNYSDSNGGIVRSANSVYLWGAQVEARTYGTSYIPTVAASATRNGELSGFTKSVPTTAGVCVAATLELASLSALPAGGGLIAPQLTSGAWNANATSPYVWPYTAILGDQASVDGTGSSAAPTGGSGFVPTAMTNPVRVLAGNTGTGFWRVCVNGSCATTASGAWASPTYTAIKFFAQTTTVSAAIWSRVQVDPGPTRCTP